MGEFLTPAGVFADRVLGGAPALNAFPFPAAFFIMAFGESCAIESELRMSAIRYGEPIRCAWGRMVAILFRPFRLSKWMGMGFTAWLAGLMQGGCNINVPSRLIERSWSSEEAMAFLREYALVILAVVLLGLLLAMVVGTLLLWLSARGKFMFLDNALGDRAEIKAPWAQFRPQGNSLFAWWLVFWSVALLAILLVAGLGGGCWVPWLRHKQALGLAVGGSVVAGLVMLVLLLALGYIQLFLEDFVIPLMLAQETTARQAWRRFGALFAEQPGAFLLYGLVKFGLSLGVTLALLLAMLLTCCCLALVMMVPFIGTVVLLPLLLFYRLIGPEFLSQFCEEFGMPAASGSAEPPAISGPPAGLTSEPPPV